MVVETSWRDLLKGQIFGQVVVLELLIPINHLHAMLIGGRITFGADRSKVAV
ncbi:unnamed protein product [Penicillium roqueforti FM164]|uniref:Genomic scaffold, ProqFM164S03 n=1 Tax=Penicillium roqueforti (strain FM164) TaxID=1365484 RepID=W6QBR7_PENRF|nr:unnamed protein product [Penicillium roqueforti FM164]